MAKKPSSARRPRISRIILWTGVTVILLAIIAYFGIGFIAADISTRPERQFSADLTPAKYGMAYEDIKVTARTDGMQIPGWFIPAQGSNRVVLMVPGRNQSRTSELYGRFVELASNIHATGLNILMIDLRGHGQAPDAHYSFGLIDRRDVAGAVDWLVQRGFNQNGIGALGISLGSSAVIGAAAEGAKIGAIVEDSCFAEIYPIIKEKFTPESGLPGILLTPTLWMVRLRYGYDMTQARPLEEIGNLAPRPLMIIHSTSDELVPEAQAEQLRAAYPQAETWILSGPEHARSFNAYPAEYSQRVNAFFAKHLK